MKQNNRMYASKSHFLRMKKDPNTNCCVTQQKKMEKKACNASICSTRLSDKSINTLRIGHSEKELFIKQFRYPKIYHYNEDDNANIKCAPSSDRINYKKISTIINSQSTTPSTVTNDVSCNAWCGEYNIITDKDPFTIKTKTIKY